MDISVQTAQNVHIAYQPAGLADRIGATMIDFILLGILYYLGFMLLSLNAVWERSTTGPFVLLTILLFYHLVCEYFFNGTSLGKHLLHLRVVRLDGRKLSFWDCLLRWVLRVIDISISMGIVAICSIIISSKMQRLGDLAAGTTVILEKRKNKPGQTNFIDPPEGYQVVFPQVAILTDKDFFIIKEVYQEFLKSQTYGLLAPLADKIKTLTGIQTRMNNVEFIKTVLLDYTQLTQ